MDRKDVTAFMIMEATGDPTKPTDLQVYDTKGLFYVKFKTVLQEFNVMNRNRRIYESLCMDNSLHAPHVQELMRKKSWFGEAGHPHSNDVARILTIDPKLISHRVNNININGNILKGEVETLDNGAYGTQMTRQIIQGMEPAFSLRALASLIKNRDGSTLVKSKCHVVSYDWVVLPSHVKAYRDQSTPVKKVVQNITSDGNTIKESMIPVQESQIIDFIKSESKNVRLVSNVCEVATESMNLTPDMSLAIIKEGSNTFAVKVEDRIKQEVRHYMSRI